MLVAFSFFFFWIDDRLVFMCVVFFYGLLAVALVFFLHARAFVLLLRLLFRIHFLFLFLIVFFFCSALPCLSFRFSFFIFFWLAIYSPGCVCPLVDQRVGRWVGAQVCACVFLLAMFFFFVFRMIGREELRWRMIGWKRMGGETFYCWENTGGKSLVGQDWWGNMRWTRLMRHDQDWWTPIGWNSVVWSFVARSVDWVIGWLLMSVFFLSLRRRLGRGKQPSAPSGFIYRGHATSVPPPSRDVCHIGLAHLVARNTR